MKRENTKGRFQEYFSFIGKESVNYIKDYLKTIDSKLGLEHLLFGSFGHEDKPVAPGILTHIFGRIVIKLRSKGVMNFETMEKSLKVETRNHRPLRDTVTRSTIRLYNLRKFFRKHAGMAGQDFVNFWMGHTAALGVDLHYFSRDVEHHRKIYAEKAMPYLRLESSTPSQTEKQIEDLRKENVGLRQQLDAIQRKTTALEELLERVQKLEQKLEDKQ